MRFGSSIVVAFLLAGAVLPLRGAVDPVRPGDGGIVLDLEACVAYAFSNALDLAQERLKVENAELSTRIARQKFAPAVSGVAGYADDSSETPGSVTFRQELPASLALSATAGSADVGGADDDPYYTVTLSKQLLGGGGYRESMLEIDNSLLDELIAGNRLSLFQRDLARRIVRQYYQLHRARQTQAIRERRLELSRTTLAHAIAREDPLDIANAQLEVPSNEAALIRAKRELENVIDGLKQLMGMPLGQPVDFVGELEYAPDEVRVEEDIERSAKGHEDVLNQRLLLRKLRNELPVRRARVLPEVALEATAARPPGDAADWGVEGRVSASWTLLERADRARVRLLENQISEARLDLDLLLSDRAVSLRSLARRLDEARLQVEVGRQRLDVAARRAALYSDRWENGAIDILEYIRSQNDFEDGRVDLVDLEIAYLEILAEYRHAVGDPVLVPPAGAAPAGLPVPSTAQVPIP